MRPNSNKNGLIKCQFPVLVMVRSPPPLGGSLSRQGLDNFEIGLNFKLCQLNTRNNVLPNNNSRK